MGSTYIIEEVGYVGDVYYAGSIFDDVTEIKFYYVYDGVQGHRRAYHSLSVAAEDAITSNTYSDSPPRNRLEFFGHDGYDGDIPVITLKSVIVDRGGMTEEEEERSLEAPTSSPTLSLDHTGIENIVMSGMTPAREAQIASAMATAERSTRDEEAHSALYLSSMSTTVSFGAVTGLIAGSSFALTWNDLEYPDLWSQSVLQQFNAIQDGDAPGAISLIKENIYIPNSGEGGSSSGEKEYNIYYDYNTGKQQRAPTFTMHDFDKAFSEEETRAWDVSYGKQEEAALKAKYKRYQGNSYKEGMSLALDSVVLAAISQIRIKSKYNFKKVDTNRRFRKKNLSLFSESGRPTEMGGVTTTATSALPMTSPRGVYTNVQ